MKVVVTGAAGRVGRAMLQELKEHGHTVWAIDQVLVPATAPADRRLLADLKNPAPVYAHLAGTDGVIHLGAYPNLQHHPGEHVFANNTAACANVAAACKALGIPRVVYASSVTTYGLGWQIRNGGVTVLPVDESAGQHPENFYALSKWVGEEIFTLAGRDGLQTASLRIALVVGPDEYGDRGQPRDERMSNGLWAYVDSRDVAQLARLALEQLDRLGPGNHPFNTGAADALTRRPLAEVIPQHLPALAPLAGAIQGNDPAFSIEKARRVLGYAPRYSWRTVLGE